MYDAIMISNLISVIFARKLLFLADTSTSTYVRFICTLKTIFVRIVAKDIIPCAHCPIISGSNIRIRALNAIYMLSALVP
jgi:hypothetical protein